MIEVDWQDQKFDQHLFLTICNRLALSADRVSTCEYLAKRNELEPFLENWIIRENEVFHQCQSVPGRLKCLMT